jgi:cellulose binding protein with CBM3 domain
MRPKCERSSPVESPVPRRGLPGVVGDFAASSLCRLWREIMSLVPWSLALSGCSPVQAEVGSGLPPTPNVDASEAGAVGRCDALAPIRLYYWNAQPGASSNLIDYVVKVENATGAPLPVSSLKVRYYLTNELMPPSTIDIFYTDTCCSNKIINFNGDILTALQTIPVKPNADAFLEIAFAAAVGSLAPGDAVQVELGFHDPAYARNLTQTNDYSYGPNATGTQVQWDSCPGAQCEPTFTTCSITVDQNDVLVWGTPP